MIKEEAKRRIKLLSEQQGFNDTLLRAYDFGILFTVQCDETRAKLVGLPVEDNSKCASQIVELEEESGVHVYLVFEMDGNRYFLAIEEDPFDWEEDPFAEGWFFAWVCGLDDRAPQVIRLVKIDTKDSVLTMRSR